MKAIIPGQSKLEAIFGQAGYTAFSKVISLNFFRDPVLANAGYSLLVILETDRRTENYRIYLRFSGVKGLTLKEFGGRPTQITGFGIIDISADQLEGMNFKVIDFEEGVIRFFCEVAEVQEVEKIR